MGLMDVLIANLPTEPIPVKSVAVGVRWTAVTSIGCGLAATSLISDPNAMHALTEAGQLHKKSVQELAQGIHTENRLEASIGLAAYNSTLVVNRANSLDINAFDLLSRLGTGKNVILVGHFPQVEWLQTRVGSLKVLEKRLRPGDYPSEAAPELIPAADVVAITAMTLLNHTLDDLLDLCAPKAKVVLIGPSAPLTPALFDHGIDFICGSMVTNEENVLLTIMQGGSVLRSNGTQKITLCKDPVTPF